MKSPLPQDLDVRAAADELLAEQRESGAYPSVTALARRLGINRTTLYRHYSTIAAYLLDTATRQAGGARNRRIPIRTDDRDDTIRRLRSENADLRRHVEIYEEHIRMLTIENSKQRDELRRRAGITDLKNRRTAR